MIKKFPKPKAWSLDKIINLLKSFNSVEDQSINDTVIDCIKWLVSKKIERKEVVLYLLKMINISKFRAFRLATQDFNRVITSYIEENYSKEDLKNYQENHLEDRYNADNTFDNYVRVRSNVIDYTLSGDAESFLDSIEGIFSLSEIDYDESDEGVKRVKSIVIDLVELAYKEQAAPLKILMGAADAK